MPINEAANLPNIPAAAGGSGGECRIGIQETKIGSTSLLLLPWVGNGINYTESSGKDVLSGPFTGCVMGAYKRGGARRVCHVATPECKDAWAKVKAETEVIKEFKPSDKLPKDFNPKALKGGLIIYGYVTADEKYYAILCDRDKTGSLKILKIIPA